MPKAIRKAEKTDDDPKGTHKAGNKNCYVCGKSLTEGAAIYEYKTSDRYYDKNLKIEFYMRMHLYCYQSWVKI